MSYDGFCAALGSTSLAHKLVTEWRTTIDFSALSGSFLYSKQKIVEDYYRCRRKGL